jgi:hypothetical protein
LGIERQRMTRFPGPGTGHSERDLQARNTISRVGDQEIPTIKNTGSGRASEDKPRFTCILAMRSVTEPRIYMTR